jgi:hypothetical protein
MSRAQEFLKWWIFHNVAPTVTRGAETRERAKALMEAFTLAAADMGIDSEDPVLNPQWLYDQMLDAILEAKAGQSGASGRRFRPPSGEGDDSG